MIYPMSCATSASSGFRLSRRTTPGLRTWFIFGDAAGATVNAAPFLFTTHGLQELRTSTRDALSPIPRIPGRGARSDVVFPGALVSRHKPV